MAKRKAPGGKSTPTANEQTTKQATSIELANNPIMRDTVPEVVTYEEIQREDIKPPNVYDTCVQ